MVEEKGRTKGLSMIICLLSSENGRVCYSGDMFDECDECLPVLLLETC